MLNAGFSVRDHRAMINISYQNVALGTYPQAELPDYVFFLYGGYVCFVFLLGIVQNAMTLFVFLKERRLWKVHNYFIVGLAISDVCMCLCSHWMIVSSTFNRKWLFGRIGCIYYGFITTALGLTQISLLAAIAFDRYAIIVKPRGFVMTPKTAVKIMTGCYFYGVFWAVCPVLGWNSYQPEGLHVRCAVNWQSHIPRDLSFSMTILILCWVLPLSLILFCYGSIFRMMKANKRKTYYRRTKRRQRLERKMAITVLLMIVAFLGSWSPYSVLTLTVAFGRLKVPIVLSILPALIAKTSIIWNPIIYVARHNAFRQACFRYVSCLTWYRKAINKKYSNDYLLPSKSSDYRERRNGVFKSPNLNQQRKSHTPYLQTHLTLEEDIGPCSTVSRYTEIGHDVTSFPLVCIENGSLSEDRESRNHVDIAKRPCRQRSRLSIPSKPLQTLYENRSSCSTCSNTDIKSGIQVCNNNMDESESSEDYENRYMPCRTLERDSTSTNITNTTFDTPVTNGYVTVSKSSENIVVNPEVERTLQLSRKKAIFPFTTKVCLSYTDISTTNDIKVNDILSLSAEASLDLKKRHDIRISNKTTGLDLVLRSGLLQPDEENNGRCKTCSKIDVNDVAQPSYSYINSYELLETRDRNNDVKGVHMRRKMILSAFKTKFQPVKKDDVPCKADSYKDISNNPEAVGDFSMVSKSLEYRNRRHGAVNMQTLRRTRSYQTLFVSNKRRHFQKGLKRPLSTEV